MTRSFPAICLIFLAVASGCMAQRTVSDQVCHGMTCKSVEIASTPEDTQKGLQDRTSLPANSGMLFVFLDSGYHPFWMKDTLIPLDMIWIDNARQVVHIEENVPPCTADPCPSYGPSPGTSSGFVLEINAGESRQWGIAVGDFLEFRLMNLD